MRAILLAALIATGPAAAEVLDTKSARKALFSSKRTTVQMVNHPALTEKDLKTIEQVVKQFRYYGVMAVSPDEGLLVAATQVAENLHSLDQATVVALEACNKERASGTSPCIVAARVVPRGYEARPVQLSQQATEAFEKEYRRKKAPKSLAISVTTTGYGVALGDGSDAAAVAACEKAGNAPGDCAVVIRD